MIKHRTRNIGIALFSLFLISFFSYVLFFSGIQVTMGKKNMVAKGAFVTTSEVAYKDIKEIELKDDIALGRRTNGLGNAIVKAGHFKNEAYGHYMLYSYNHCHMYVEITCKDGTVIVLNAKDEQKTRQLYQALLRRVQ